MGIPQAGVDGLFGGGAGGLAKGVFDVSNTFGAAAINAAATSALTQGLAVVTGLQDKFSWRSVAASAIAAPVAQFVGAQVFEQAAQGAAMGVGDRLARSMVSGVVSQGVRMLVTRKGKVDYASIAGDAFGNAIGASIAAESQPKRNWLAGSGLSLGSSSSAEAGSADQGSIGLWSFSSRLGRGALDRLDAALTAGDARIAQRAYTSSGSSSVENEVLPFSYLARDGTGHNTPQTAVLVEGRATRDWLELDDYDALGNRTGYGTRISAAPTTMSYGDQMRNAFWGAAQMAYGGVTGAVNGVPAFVVGTVKGYAYIGAGLRDVFDSLVGNRSSNYLDRAIQAGTPYTVKSGATTTASRGWVDTGENWPALRRTLPACGQEVASALRFLTALVQDRCRGVERRSEAPSSWAMRGKSSANWKVKATRLIHIAVTRWRQTSLARFRIHLRASSMAWLS